MPGHPAPTPNRVDPLAFVVAALAIAAFIVGFLFITFLPLNPIGAVLITGGCVLILTAGVLAAS